MSNNMKTVALAAFGLLCGASPAFAGNSSVENTLASYPDTSKFYQALLNTGVANELDENTRYTVFAPTNAAFAEIAPTAYPCFYSVQCRAQVAEVLRNHIVAGGRTLAELANETEVPTKSGYRVYVESPFVGDYAVANHRVLSQADVNGNMIDRIDGVVIHRSQLAQFRALPPVASNTTTERTIITYHSPDISMIPGGGYPFAAGETVTEKTYYAPGEGATVYSPDGSTTVEKTYTAPRSTETIITEP